MREFISTLIKDIRFKAKKRKALKLHRMTGRQFFVLPDNEGRLLVIDNQMRDAYNSLVHKSERMTFKELCEKSWYKTPKSALVR